MDVRFEKCLASIESKDCETDHKNSLLRGQIQSLRLAIEEQRLQKQQNDQIVKEMEKRQVIQALKEEQQKLIEDKELQLIQVKRELHLRQDACEDLQFEIEQQQQYYQQQLENLKILDSSISRLMDSVQKLKRSPLKNNNHARMATSQSFDDHHAGYFGFMGILRSRNNIDDYIEKVEKFNTSRLHDH